MSSLNTRHTAQERREAVFDVAAHEFARKGLHGASTDEIARRAGISQPYLFRLFRTKKDLYLETVGRKLEETYRVFEQASRGKSGEEALRAMGDAYTELTAADRDRILLMLQCFASCEDEDVRTAVRAVWRDLVELVEQRSGAPAEEVSSFFADGMLLTVSMAMNLFEEPTPWGDRLIGGCLADKD
jgi:AcrR family transcriptional regulator